MCACVYASVWERGRDRESEWVRGSVQHMLPLATQFLMYPVLSLAACDVASGFMIDVGVAASVVFAFAAFCRCCLGCSCSWCCHGCWCGCCYVVDYFFAIMPQQLLVMFLVFAYALVAIYDTVNWCCWCCYCCYSALFSSIDVVVVVDVTTLLLMM